MWSDDFPLALIFEELIEIEKPKDKEQEQGAEKTEKDKGGGGISKPLPYFLCSLALAMLKSVLSGFLLLVYPDTGKRQKPLYGIFTAFCGLFRSIVVLSAACATCGGLRPPPVLGGSGSAPPPPKGG